MNKVIFPMLVGGIIGAVIMKQHCEIKTMKLLQNIEEELEDVGFEIGYNWDRRRE